MRKKLITGLLLGLGALVAADEFYFNIARGWINGLRSVNKFGRTTNADNGVATDIWDGANATTDDDIWNFWTSTNTVYVRSSDTDDDGSPAGNGAHAVRIFGLDSNWEEVNETITLNGTTNVEAVNKYIRVFRMYVTAAGATGSNEGIIIASGSVAGTVTAQINVGEGQTQMAVYTVPANKIGFLTHYYASGNRASPTGVNADIALLAKNDADTSTSLFVVKHTQSIADDGTGYLHHEFDLPVRFGGKTDIKLQVTANGDNSDISGGFDLILMDNY